MKRDYTSIRMGVKFELYGVVHEGPPAEDLRKVVMILPLGNYGSLTRGITAA